MPGPELRPRTGTEIVDAAFQLYGRHFGELLALNALVFAPFILLNLVLTGGQAAEPTFTAAIAMVLMVVGWIFGSIAEAAMTLAVSNAYLHGSPDVPDALRRTFGRLAAVMFASLAKWFIITLAFAATMMVVSVPAALFVAVASGAGAMALGVIAIVAAAGAGAAVGFYFFCRYFAVVPAVVLEGVGVRGALRRSSALSAGYKRKVALTLGLPMILLVLLQFMLMSMLGLLLSALPLVGTLLEQVVTLVVSPIISIIAVLLYYDARIVKEGFDIEVLAAALGDSAGLSHAAPPA